MNATAYKLNRTADCVVIFDDPSNFQKLQVEESASPSAFLNKGQEDSPSNCRPMQCTPDSKQGYQCTFALEFSESPDHPYQACREETSS